jgi:pimeloyl-ACP methyl ester carboxylesterase
MIFLPFRRPLTSPVRLVLAVLLLLLLGAGLLAAQTPTPRVDRFTLLYLAANDTVGVERLERTDSALVGDLSVRGLPRMRWTERLHEPAGVHTLRIEAWRPGAATTDAPMQRLVLQIRGDSAYVYNAPAGNAPLGAPVATLPARANARWLVNQSLAHAAWLSSRTAGDTAWFVLASGASLQSGVLSRQGDSLTLTLAGLRSVFRLAADGALLGVHVPAQGIRGVVVRGDAAARLTTTPAAPVSYDAPAGAPYTATEVRVPTSMGHTLAGTLTRPRTATARVPVAITITGSGPQERDEAIPGVEGYRLFRQVADTLGRRGIAVLRLDDRGVGASGGNHSTATSRDFADDVRAAIAWLRTRDDIDPDRIALVGHSEGGLIAPLVAADDARLAAIVLMAGPAYSGARIIAFQQRSAIAQLNSAGTEASRDTMFRLAQQQLDSTARSNPWIREFLQYDPLPTARRVRTPVLVLQGDTDQQVTPEQADTLVAAFVAGRNDRITMHRLPNTNHLFQRDSSGVPGGYGTLADRRVTAETLGRLADWLVSTLAGPSR